jgi:hypothetical protein
MNKFVGSFLLGIVVLVGCSSGSPSSMPVAPDDASTPTDTAVPTVKTYCYYESSTEGDCFSFSSDGNYVWDVLELTSDTSADAQIETGTYTQTKTEFSFTPKEWSCYDVSEVKPFTASYTLNGNDLFLSLPTNDLSLTLDTTPAATNFDITVGCFGSAGFVANPLDPVDGGEE